MKIVETSLPEVLLIEPRVFGDHRGYFMETYRAHCYAAAGIPGPFVQDNLSFSRRGTLRGLHYQLPDAQGKLVQVLSGEAFDVAVDIRVGSPTFSKWFGTVLSDQNRRQLYIPEGFAHGFCVTSETALFVYKCTAYYNAAAESVILWNDPDIGIQWPVDHPTLSEKDAQAPTLSAIEAVRLPCAKSI
jgi:dTDP-4-dehydrorhamnose 3,5-epimerase